MVVAVWALNQLYINSTLPSELIAGLTLLLYTVASCIVNKGKWHQHILTTFIFVGFSGIFDTIFLYGASSMIGISVSDLVWRKFSYVVIVTSGKLFILPFPCIPKDTVARREMVVSFSFVSHNLNGDTPSYF